MFLGPVYTENLYQDDLIKSDVLESDSQRKWPLYWNLKDASQELINWREIHT